MTIKEAAQVLREKDNFLILTHMRPDGDTMGSAAALCYALNKAGKRAYLFNNTQFDDYMPWIVAAYIEPEGYSWDYVISVDTADKLLFPIGFKGEADLSIDHHPSNSGYARQTVLMGEKASCGEVVMEIIRELLGGFDKTIADLLYIAISTDTGCFVYGNTTGDTLRAAAELCDAGASNTALNKVLFRTSSKARLALEGMMYSDFHYYHNGRTVVSILTREMMKKAGAVETDCADLASIPGRVQDSATTALLREGEDNHTKISIRTNGLVNASTVCRKFDGGGHAMAAGCVIKAPVAEAERLIIEAITEELE